MFSLKRQLKKLRQATSPRREFKSELWNKLSSEFDSAYGPLPKARRASLRFRLTAVGLTALVLLLGIGTSAYAYESPQVSEGHMLFPVKQGIERVEGWLVRHPEAKARFHLKMMQRRLNEADLHRGQREKLLEYAAAELGMTVEELESELIDPDKRSEIISSLAEQNEQFMAVFNDLSRPEPRFAGINERLRQLKERLDQSDFTPEQKNRIMNQPLRQLIETGSQPQLQLKQLNRK